MIFTIRYAAVDYLRHRDIFDALLRFMPALYATRDTLLATLTDMPMPLMRFCYATCAPRRFDAATPCRYACHMLLLLFFCRYGA